MGSGDEAKHHEVVEKARGMLRDLQAEPDPSTLRVLEILADTIAERVFAGIDVDEEGIERLREAARRGSVVLLPSHKSHVDYLLLHYVLRKHSLSLPLVAAGDNLSFFPLGSLLRRSGAFFIRRNFRGDKLYAIVVDAYVRRLLRDGYAIEFFLEGGRSRTGKLLPPQLGLLNMVVDAALGVDGRSVSFVPVSIGYERMMEETEFLRELSGEAKKGEDLGSLVTAGRALLGSYGRPNVQIGRVFDLADLRRSLGIPDEPSPAKRRSLVSSLAQLAMDEINRVTAVTPGALVATVLLCHPRRGMPHTELVIRAERLLALVRSLGARTTPKLTDGPDGPLSEPSIREAAEVYVRGGLLRCHSPGDTLTGVRGASAGLSEDRIWIVPEERRIALDIPKNMIVHLFTPRALVAIALGAQRQTIDPARASSGPPSGAFGWDTASVISRARFLARLLHVELSLRVDATFDARFHETLDAMIAASEIARTEGGTLVPGAGHDGLDGRGWLHFYAAVLRNFLEGYRIAARALRTLVVPSDLRAASGLRSPASAAASGVAASGQRASVVPAPVDAHDFVLRALRIGEQMFLGGEIERAEAVSRPLLENALLVFRELGFLARSAGASAAGGRDADLVTLAPSHATESGAAAIEAQIADYLTTPIYGSDY